MNIRLMNALWTSALVCSSAIAQQADTAQNPVQAKVAAAPIAAVTVPFFGNKICPESGKPTKADKFVERDGQRIYSCCSKCRKKIAADFDKYLAEAYPADQLVDVKDTACSPSGDSTAAGKSGKNGKNDEETESITIYQGYRIHHSCADCAQKFLQAPRRNLALLLDPNLTALGNEMCIVTTDEAAEPDSFFIYEGVLINACCDDCVDDFKDDPEGILADAGVDLAKIKASDRGK